LVRQFKASPSTIEHEKVFVADHGSHEVTMAQLGVGPATAHRVTRRLVDAVRPDRVVVCGIAGGVAPEMSIGTVVYPSEVVDEASGLRYRPGPLGRLDPSGVIATVDRLICDLGEVEELVAQGISALDMETSGVASACEEADVAWSVLRVISDRPDGGLTDDAVIGLLRPDGTPNGAAALRLMVRHPGKVPGLIRLGRDSSRAASKMAKTTFDVLI
jgi:adenosylhomocysteine nucleosidase